ncbi:MAG: ATP-binding protein [Aggregatilineales bacterium]
MTQDSAHHYQKLYEFSHSLHQQQLDIQRTMQQIVRGMAHALSVEHGCLISFQENSTIENVYVLGAGNNIRIAPKLWDNLLRYGMPGHVYHSGRIVHIRDIQNDPRWQRIPELEFFPTAGSAIGIPLSTGTFMHGVLFFVHPTLDYFKDAGVHLLEAMSDLASTAIANAQALTHAREGDVSYQALFDGGIVPIIMTDVNGSIQDANLKACDFLGYNRRSLQNILLSDLNIRAPYDIHTLEDNEERSFRSAIYDMDGQEISTLMRTRRISLDGRIVVEWVLQDMSAEVELEQLKSDLTAMVYHDLRGPLTNIVASIYKLSSVLKNHDNPAVLRLLQIGLQSTQQLQRMVESLLDIQRLEDGKAILNRQAIEVRVPVTDAVQLVTPLAADAGQQIIRDIDPKLPLVRVDVDMIMRVIINLMENAVKYTPTEGTITTIVRCVDDRIEVRVRDSGPGIPEEMRVRIFDKFSRVKYENAPRGLGLGLAFCRLAVEAHGGRIWVDSVVGEGSDFCFTLPLGGANAVSDSEKMKALA